MNLSDGGSDGHGWRNLLHSAIPTVNDNNWNVATCNFSAKGYRLPTESEWEYAARGGKLTHDYVFAGGGANRNDYVALDTLGWYEGNNGPQNITSAPFYGTKPVATKAPNELGLYDMSGNVYEWCQDWYGGTFPYATPTGTNPAANAATGFSRVSRGGDWGYTATDCRVSGRAGTSLNGRSTGIGLRVVLVP